MNTTVTIDKAGRIVIPKTLRDEFHLQPGDTMELQSEGDSFVLRQVRSSSPLRKEQGVWVFRTNNRVSAASTDKALKDLRDERDAAQRGSRR